MDTFIQKNDLLHHTGTIDFFLRPFDITGKHAVYSRNRPTNTEEGSEDFLTFYIENNSDAPNTGTITALLASGSESDIIVQGTNADSDLVSSGSWVHIAVKWSWSSGSRATTLSLVRNGEQIAQIESSLEVFVHDDLDNLSFIGKELNFGSPDQESGSYFQGLIYAFGVSNYLPALSAFISTTCSRYTGCSLCPADGLCLSLCDLDKYPVSGSDSCGLCDDSCHTGCVRGSDCVLCNDKFCDSCTDFEDGSCTSCTGLTILGTGASAGVCLCD